MSSKPLVIIPTYLRSAGDLEVTMDAVKSIRDTDLGMVDILIVDDGSPERDLADKMAEDAEREYGAETHRKTENSGFSKTVNVGLRRALQEGRDAVLMNADVEIMTTGWINQWRSLNADVAGALLLYPNGLIQHGGIYFSLLTRSFDHLWKFAPMDLPDAHKRTHCPVTGAFQFIRHKTLTTVGLYDESFYMGWEDVDYCLRVLQAGLTCVYDPDVRAWHHEMLFRGRKSPKVQEWQAKSWMRLAEKYKDTSFNEMVPFL